MLGNGRPFLVELVCPRRLNASADELHTAMERINVDGRIYVADLAIVGRNAATILRDGEESKRKTYACVVWLSRDLR